MGWWGEVSIQEKSMKRSSNNLRKYKKTCELVYERADGCCEVIVGCSRCNRYIPYEQVRYINYLHKATRNGKSDEWVLDPNNIILGCATHHLEEERTGVRVKYIN